MTFEQLLNIHSVDPKYYYYIWPVGGDNWGMAYRVVHAWYVHVKRTCWTHLILVKWSKTFTMLLKVVSSSRYKDLCDTRRLGWYCASRIYGRSFGGGGGCEIERLLVTNIKQKERGKKNREKRHVGKLHIRA